MGKFTISMAIFNSKLSVSSPEGILQVMRVGDRGALVTADHSEWLKLSFFWLPSGELTVCYGKWPFIVDFPIKNGGSFHCYVSSPEGNVLNTVIQDKVGSGCWEPSLDTETLFLLRNLTAELESLIKLLGPSFFSEKPPILQWPIIGSFYADFLFCIV